jgi:hypothetical protein
MDSSQPCISIVIPNWNGKEMLKICLASLARQTYQSFFVTVVDNGSEDGSVEWIQGNYPDVQVLSLSDNTGFCKAVNLGIQSSNHPYVFLLNNDTELASDCLSFLVAAGQTQSGFDFFAAKMLSFYERDKLDGAGDGFLRGGAGYRLGTMETDSEHYSRAGAVFGACGGAAFYRRKLFETIGFFDEDFFAYLEDVDLNLRANRSGLHCYYVPQAKIYHIGSATTGSKFNDFTIRLSTRNSFFVLLKNYPTLMFIRFLPVILTYQFFWFLFIVKKKMIVPYFAGILEVFKHGPAMRRKFSHRTGRNVPDKEFAKNLKLAERNVIKSIMQRRQANGKGNLLLRIYAALFL